MEVYRDHALGIPPLNATLAERLMEQTRIFEALKGVRGRAPVDVTKLQQILVHFSQLIVEQPRIKEIDINPLLAAPERIVALDARIVLHSAEIADANLPRPAIRPYPAQYVCPWKMPDGEKVLIRPIRAEDEPLMVKFHEGLSAQSVYLRYFHMENLSARVSHERLIRKCFVDYDREIALVVERAEAPNGKGEIIAVGRLSKINSAGKAEVAVLVSDVYQHRGLGGALLQRLIDVARKEGIREIVANILPENLAMRALAYRFHFDACEGPEFGTMTATLELAQGA